MNGLAVSTLPFLQALADGRNDILTKFMNLVTYLGDEKLFVLIALVVFWCFSKQGGLYMLTVGFGASSIGQTLKSVFRVPRPWNLGDQTFGGADPIARGTEKMGGLLGKITGALGTGADGWSFPSGHTLISVGTYGGMARWFRSKGARIIGILLAVLIPFSRLYLGVHTVVDVICGAIISLILVLALYPVFARGSRNAVRGVLIGNIALSAVTLGIVYLLKPNGLEGEDIGNYASGVKNLWQLIGATAALEIGFEADERWLHFETKAVWWAQALKVLGGAVIVLALQLGIQKLLGYSSKELTLENMTRMGIIACFANLVAIGAATALWPKTFRWFSGLGRK